MTAPGPAYLADRRRISAVRPARAPHGPTARPTTSLADAALLPDPAAPPALDAPRVQTNHRMYLSSCLEELGWQPASRSVCGSRTATAR